MVIDEMKKEMVEFGFENQIDNATEIIYFIGVGQDLAWREGEGVIRSDISINKSLLNFLKQGYILEDESKYAKYPIYKLNVQGEEILQELVEANKPNFEGFRNEFLKIYPKTFALLDNPNNKDIDRLKVQYKCKILFDIPEKGNELEMIFYEKMQDFHRLLEKYDSIIELTSFQSNKIGSKSKFIKSNDFYQLLIEYIESFPTQLYDSITELNKKASFFDDLIISIQEVEIRDKIRNKHLEFYDDYKFLMEELKDNKITTQFDSSRSPCFKIIDEQKFKNEIEKRKKNYIDKVSDPIIDELIDNRIDNRAGQQEDRLLQPDLSFTNLRYLWETIEKCNEYIYWFDPYFTINGFKYLKDEVHEDKIKRIKILSGTKQTNERLKEIYEKFKSEMENKGIVVEFRIIIDNYIRNLHDRFLISKDVCYNLPSINTIDRGQFSEIKITKNRPPFDDWWSNGKDIINEWQKIKKVIEK